LTKKKREVATESREKWGEVGFLDWLSGCLNLEGRGNRFGGFALVQWKRVAPQKETVSANTIETGGGKKGRSRKPNTKVHRRGDKKGKGKPLQW